MTAAGFEVTDASFEYTDELDLDHRIGGLYSAMRLPPPISARPSPSRSAAPWHRLSGSPSPVLVRMLLGRARSGLVGAGVAAVFVTDPVDGFPEGVADEGDMAVRGTQVRSAALIPTSSVTR